MEDGVYSANPSGCQFFWWLISLTMSFKLDIVDYAYRLYRQNESQTLVLWKRRQYRRDSVWAGSSWDNLMTIKWSSNWLVIENHSISASNQVCRTRGDMGMQRKSNFTILSAFWRRGQHVSRHLASRKLCEMEQWWTVLTLCVGIHRRQKSDYKFSASPLRFLLTFGSFIPRDSFECNIFCTPREQRGC